mmetsp:Transcript_50241/g.162655  ORF Transcript_50241/g.162655 Transcript_50241/m.162655 type:complete len:417 (-) Transcript_50241:238-1488(-)|eukprot:CAMPEP_0203872122 /NCGR_PEP_ID=MMETSP0359-20131031/19086_1 /ASSEMBLY_ACC=CAM_ASM_000338 /TAXON_ID=268821 /ORGANISM="Scrippsiella Hangoei, Strain SHTV-5" /LENGTH=416 /DNA_ID=CAMNT_0050790807 /DNA_START=45 /DNA_END=1295 /DNA_ORIENTATION=+
MADGASVGDQEVPHVDIAQGLFQGPLESRDVPREEAVEAGKEDAVALGGDAPVASSTADSSNRMRDKRKVEAKLKLPEFGDECTVFCDARDGRRVAVGYLRVVYGDHGAYVECRPEQVIWEGFELRNTTAEYYDLYKSVPPGRAQVYLQKRTVSDRPNPPQGRDSKQHDRPQGYADYQPGLVYISVKQVTVKREEFAAPRTYTAPVKGKPHEGILKGALKKMAGVRVLDDVLRETRFLKDGKHRRFTRVPAESISALTGIPLEACVKVAVWVAEGRPVAMTVVPRSAAVDIAALEGLLGVTGLRLASDRQLEAAAGGAKLRELMLPLHPALGAECRVLLDAEVMWMPKVAFNALCGVVSVVETARLLSFLPGAEITDLARKDSAAPGCALGGGGWLSSALSRMACCCTAAERKEGA